jgi:tetratricopeptide (TPR) repeat protein
MNPKKYLFLYFLIAVFCSYGNSLEGDFIWDDKPLIVENPLVRDPRAPASIFSAELYAQSGANYYRPLLTLSFILNSLFFGSDPFGYHLVNILLHVFVGWFFYVFLTRSGAAFFVSFAASLLFLVHPLQAQVVTYISGRADSLAALFLMASLIFYTRIPRERKNTLAACLLFIMALLTKETAIVFPLVLMGVDGCLGKKESLKKVLPFFVIAGMYVFLRTSLLNFSPANPFIAKKGFAIFEVGFLERLLIFIKTLVIYLGSFLVPVRLHMERIIAFEKIDLALMTGFGGCLVLGGWVLRRARASSARFKKILVFFLFWFFIWLLPQSAFVFPKIMAEHFLYLSSMSLCLFAAFCLDSVRLEKYKYALLCAVLFIFASLSWQHNKDWFHELGFFERTVALSPHSVRARDSLASLYLKAGRLRDAEREYQQLLDLNKDCAGRQGCAAVEAATYYNLALVYERSGSLTQALLAYKKAMVADPEMEEAYNNEGLLLQRMGLWEEAERSFEKAILLNKGYYRAYNNLAHGYAQQGRFDEALKQWHIAVAVHPGYEIAKKNIAIAQSLVKKD